MALALATPWTPPPSAHTGVVAKPTTANHQSSKRAGEEDALFAINTMTNEEAHNRFQLTRHTPSTNGVQGDYTHNKP